MTIQTQNIPTRVLRSCTRRELGVWGENLATSYLAEHDWAILERNWNTRGGELDIVAFDPHRHALVAVEVKTRRSRRNGSPEQAVTPAKVQRLRGLLLQWAVMRKSYCATLAIDVIGVEVDPQGRHTIHHIQDVGS
ncbi:YraN family protein [Trueperella sp. LYQ141]|uniref:YraN family protein n=1 Tax=Trueperella sp. LYQ141 TaxID=3391058 RepID=UPI0039832762